MGRNLARSMRLLGKKEVVSKSTMSRIFQEDLKMFPNLKKRQQLLSKATKKKRLD